MTTRQQLRLERAEAVCRLAMRHHTCGLVDAEGYRPDVIGALYAAEREALRAGHLELGSLPWIREHAEALQSALFAWMEAVGIDPASREKAETQLVAMEMVTAAAGLGYEANVVQLPGARQRWVEHTADERAASIAQEFCAGKIKGLDELRIAIAGEILEAEFQARDPFVQYATAIFQSCEDAKVSGPEAQERALVDATAHLLQAAARWMNIVRRPTGAAEVQG
jgi:hypothetical protein